LLRALFITSVGTIEPLVTRLVHLLLHHTEPQTYASLDDSELDKKARELCLGPPSKWRRAFVDHFGVSVLADAVDWDRLDILWEDRNVIAHRGGVVDARHSARTGIQIGTSVTPASTTCSPQLIMLVAQGTGVPTV
jgi:hypothetical protein